MEKYIKSKKQRVRVHEAKLVSIPPQTDYSQSYVLSQNNLIFAGAADTLLKFSLIFSLSRWVASAVVANLKTTRS